MYNKSDMYNNLILDMLHKKKKIMLPRINVVLQSISLGETLKSTKHGSCAYFQESWAQNLADSK